MPAQVRLLTVRSLRASFGDPRLVSTSMPTALRWLARVNPVTYAVDAARRLCFGQPAGTSLRTALLLVCAAATIGSYFAVRNFAARK